MAARKTAAPKTKPAKPSPKGKETKQQRLIAMLRRPDGATIAQMAKASGWQPHTVRGAIAGAIKKKLGLAVIAAKENRGRVYRIAGSPE